MSTTTQVAVRANAKVNLFLNVAGRRPDGYHELEMFNVTISLCDDILIETTPGKEGVEIASNDKFLENGDNLITRVAKALLQKRAPAAGVRIAIEKRIPAGAGLGGNSADAAAVIRGLDVLFGWSMTSAEMERFALGFGADIPYCLRGGPAFVGGIGERIRAVPLDLSSWSVLVVNPPIYVGTDTVFAAWDQGSYPPVSLSPFAAAVFSSDVPGMLANMRNALEPVTFALSPAVREWKTKIVAELGPEGVVMTGSGSTIIKLFMEKTEKITRFIEEYAQKCHIFTGRITNKE